MDEKIDPNLWSDDPEPHLIGGRLASGEIVFPMPVGDAAEGVAPYKLKRRGRLWSWTTQGFLPKEPYIGPGAGPGEGPEDFKPFLLGYVELPGEVIVESRLVDCQLADLHLGMELELCIVPFNARYDTFAFRPVSISEAQAA